MALGPSKTSLPTPSIIALVLVGGAICCCVGPCVLMVVVGAVQEALFPHPETVRRNEALAKVKAADSQWDAGQKAAAIAAYADMIDHSTTSMPKHVYERVISHHFEQKQLEEARKYCLVAAKRGLDLRIANSEAHNFYRMAKLDYDLERGVVGNETIPAKKWYDGGTLHKKTALDWQQADPADKLATAGDFISAMWQGKNLKPSIQDSIQSTDDIRPYAEQLVVFMDRATRKDPNEETNSQLYANQDVSQFAVIGMRLMGWTKK